VSPPRNLALALMSFVSIISPLAGQQKNLGPEQQTTFLAARASSFPPGSFDSVCSFLYALDGVAIHSQSTVVNGTRLMSTFPDFYRPTWKELFDLIAWQTMSVWKYDGETGYWVFAESKRVLPYKMDISAGWMREDHPIEVVYRPPTAPVGMDIYWLGHYSPDRADPAPFFGRVREALALSFVKGFIRDVSLKNMSAKRMGRNETLYFETVTPSGVVWRQWVLIENGDAFAIVSAIKPEMEKQLLPDVLSMVSSFEIAAGKP
jgi:hypothetical protein